MLFVILLVFYFCYFIVIEVNRNYHSFKTISPFLNGSNPPVNSLYPASLDQSWKAFAISSKLNSVIRTGYRQKKVSRGRGFFNFDFW